MITALIATLAIGQTKAPVDPLTKLNCPIMGHPASAGSAVSDYNGVRVSYCCGGCKTAYEKDPAGGLKKAAKTGTAGLFLFDPVSRKRIEAKTAKGGSSDYQGVRFYFQTADNKKKFDKSPKTYGVLPAKEMMYCPVMKEKIADYADADSYADYKGVRVYFCCGGCPGPFAKSPEKYFKVGSSFVKKPGVANAK